MHRPDRGPDRPAPESAPARPSTPLTLLAASLLAVGCGGPAADPSPGARAEALAPRLSAEERLVLARLPEALAQIAPRSRPESTQVAGADGAADGETGRAAVPRGG
ncbi:MAG TPA: hypothetical protein RMH26_12800, partial [Polyangiaceae bacterium LLY-WYZ-15_(1-7)]|nr:hypothetical protein [Polyangiaceae bacterium LLY-WYZ-15_(1-7)]